MHFFCKKKNIYIIYIIYFFNLHKLTYLLGNSNDFGVDNLVLENQRSVCTKYFTKVEKIFKKPDVLQEMFPKIN